MGGNGTQLTKDASPQQADAWRQRYEGIRDQERQLLLSLLDTLSTLKETPPDTLERLQDGIRHLTGLFYLVILGEFNAGKSALINALLGTQLMPEGITPTTNKIHLVTHGPTVESEPHGNDIVAWTFPADWLEGVCIVDTPGSNSLFQQHERLARQFIHWGDTVFFVMAANRAFAETDRLYLDLIEEFRTKIILVVNQIDLLTGPEEVKRVVRYVEGTFRQLTGLEPEVLPVSAHLAQEAAEAEDDEKGETLWQRSGFQAIWEIIREITAERNRARRVLLTAANVGRWAVDQGSDQITAGLAAWQDERDLLDNVTQQWNTFIDNAVAARQTQLDELDTIFAEVDDRAKETQSRYYQLDQISDALGGIVGRLPFIRAVRESRDPPLDTYLKVEVPEQVARPIREHIQAVIHDGYDLLTSTADHLNTHLTDAAPEVRDQVIGEIRVPSDVTTDIMVEVSTDAEIDRAFEKAGLSDFLQQAHERARHTWWQFLGWEAVVLVISWIASNFIPADPEQRGQVLGWMVAGSLLLALCGLLLFPFRRRTAQRDLDQHVENLKTRIKTLLTSESEELLGHYRQAWRTLIGPYQRLVESKEGQLAHASDRLEEIDQELVNLRERLAKEQVAS